MPIAVTKRTLISTQQTKEALTNKKTKQNKTKAKQIKQQQQRLQRKGDSSIKDTSRSLMFL